jgi:hypothetical protein
MKNKVSKEIRNYIKKQILFSIPQLQVEFSLNYYNAHRIVDILLKEKSIEYCNGIEYKVVDKEKPARDIFGSRKEFSSYVEEYRRKKEMAEAEEQRKNAQCDDEDDDDIEDLEMDNDDIEEDEISQKELEALRKRVLKYCIDRGRASVSMIQIAFQIGFIRSCKMIDWMEAKGYISSASDIGGRKMLISEADFNRIYGVDTVSKTVQKYREELEKRRQEILKKSQSTEEANEDKVDNKKSNNESVECNNENDEVQFENGDKDIPCAFINEMNVTKVLNRLIKSDKTMTRNGAIKRVEGCIDNARSKEFFNSAIFLKRVMDRLVEMSDYKYKKLRQHLCDGNE